MDFIVEFLLQFFFGLFFEEPAEAIMDSKRLKPWAKTVLLFLAFNILTVILLVIYGVMAKDPMRASDAQAALYFAIAWGAIMTVLCIIGHHNIHENERRPALRKDLNGLFTVLGERNGVTLRLKKRLEGRADGPLIINYKNFAKKTHVTKFSTDSI